MQGICPEIRNLMTFSRNIMNGIDRSATEALLKRKE